MSHLDVYKLTWVWNAFHITEIHKWQFHSYCRSLYMYSTNHDIQIIRKMEINLFYDVYILYSIKHKLLFFFKRQRIFFSYFKTKVHLHLEVAYRFTKKRNGYLRVSVTMLVIAFMLRFYQDQIFHIKILDSIICFIPNYLFWINLAT